MQFKVLKSGFDGISGGDSSYDTINDVLREISYHKGWNTKAQLHKAIRQWAKNANPGSVFSTQASAIVAVSIGSGIHEDDICTKCGLEGMDYGEMDGVEGGDIEQVIECPHCGARWTDVFTLTDRRAMFKRSVTG